MAVLDAHYGGGKRKGTGHDLLAYFVAAGGKGTIEGTPK